MDYSEDYYEILQVHQLAEPEVIEAAYKKLAQKYHPDVNKSPAAMERMKKINEAHDVLGDALRRKDYDSHRGHSRTTPPRPKEPPAPAKQRPLLKVMPRHIRFKDLDYSQCKATHFDISNIGGPYTGYSLGADRLPQWLEITGIEKLGSQSLPARVHIKASGQFVGTQYDCVIPVRIENAESDCADETQVRIEVSVKGPILEVDNSYLRFNVMTGVLSEPLSVRLTNTGVGHIEGDLVPRQRWIKVSPRHVSFPHQQVVQVQIDTAHLVNNMVGYIDIKTNCAQHIITVEASPVAEKKKGK
jgi:hypothetical protein